MLGIKARHWQGRCSGVSRQPVLLSREHAAKRNRDRDAVVITHCQRKFMQALFKLFRCDSHLREKTVHKTI